MKVIEREDKRMQEEKEEEKALYSQRGKIMDIGRNIHRKKTLRGRQSK